MLNWIFPLICISIFLFVIGFHNIDIAINLEANEMDMQISGIVSDKITIYRIGLIQIFTALLLLLFTNITLLNRFLLKH